MKDRQKLIVCSLGPAGAELNATSDLAGLLGRVRRSGKLRVPVAAVFSDPEVFKRAAIIQRLPVTIPIVEAARIFGGLPVAPVAQRPIARELRRLGAMVAPVLLEWQRAVQLAKEVAA